MFVFPLAWEFVASYGVDPDITSTNPANQNKPSQSSWANPTSPVGLVCPANPSIKPFIPSQGNPNFNPMLLSQNVFWTFCCWAISWPFLCSNLNCIKLYTRPIAIWICMYWHTHFVFPLWGKSKLLEYSQVGYSQIISLPWSHACVTSGINFHWCNPNTCLPNLCDKHQTLLKPSFNTMLADGSELAALESGTLVMSTLTRLAKIMKFMNQMAVTIARWTKHEAQAIDITHRDPEQNFTTNESLVQTTLSCVICSGNACPNM